MQESQSEKKKLRVMVNHVAPSGQLKSSCGGKAPPRENIRPASIISAWTVLSHSYTMLQVTRTELQITILLRLLILQGSSLELVAGHQAILQVRKVTVQGPLQVQVRQWVHLEIWRGSWGFFAQARHQSVHQDLMYSPYPMKGLNHSSHS